MKILFVTPPPYLPNRLHRIRSFDLIKMLSLNNEVHLLSAVTSKKQPEEFKQIYDICKSVTIIKINKIKVLLNCLRFPQLPLEVAYCYSPKISREIKKIVKNKKIDILYLKRLRSAVYYSNLKIPIILDTTDAMSMFYLRMSENHKFPKNIFYLLEAFKYRQYEKNVAQKIKNWIVCSQLDKNYLETITNMPQIHVIPNAVDTSYFFPQRIKASKNTLLFRGLMDKPINVNAAHFLVKEIFPKVQRQIKDAKLFIVGPNPTEPIKKLAKKNKIIITGYVEDVREYINSTKVSLCPVRIGSGTRYKITQSWAIGRPVISTTIGAEGLNYIDGENILIADNPKDFAQKIIILLKKRKLYDKLAENGKKTVESYYSFNTVSKKLEELLNSVKNE